MTTENIFIQNRLGLKMALRITHPKNANKLAFIEHGLSGSKDEKHLKILEDAFISSGYTVVNMDATNSLNDSESSAEGISFTSHYHDLQDVINWAKKQKWYREPFALTGHSLGATAVVFYAENYPSEVNLLLPIGFPWLSGYSKEEQDGSDFTDAWKRTGFYDKESARGRILKVPFHFSTDLKAHDFLKLADKITALTVLIIGDDENKIRLQDNRKLYDKLICPKELILLPGAPHQIADTPEHAQNFKNAVEEILKD